MNRATIRLMSDLKQMQEGMVEGISACPNDKNLMLWNASIFGPEETPYENGVYQLNLVFSDMYPDKPPKVKFTTSMFHPNIYPDGSICLDILNPDKWSSVYSVSTILTSIRSLLSDENPTSPANPEAALLFVNDRKAYNRKVRAYAEKSIN
eukprot:gene10223-12537_t